MSKFPSVFASLCVSISLLACGDDDSEVETEGADEIGDTASDTTESEDSESSESGSSESSESEGSETSAEDSSDESAEEDTSTDTGEPSRCAPTQPLELLDDQGGLRLYRYDTVVDDTTFAVAAVASPTQAEYVAWLEQIDAQYPDVDVFDQHDLLARQRDVFVEAGLDDGALWDALIEGSVGELSDVICFQSIVVDQQNQDWPLWDAGSEAGAAVLLRESGGQTELRAYIVTQDAVAGVPDNQYIQLAAADLSEGWTFFAHFHNHFYASDNPYDLAGTTIPSDPDISTYQSLAAQYGIEEAWISNGVHSLVLEAAEFDLL